MDLVGTVEVAELIEVSRQRVDHLGRRDDFLEPVARLASERVWKRRSIEEWARETGRLGHR